MNSASSMNIYFDPLVPEAWLYAAGALALLLVLLPLLQGRRLPILRVLCASAFLLALLNPSLLQEEREAVSETAVILVDRSPSQSFEERMARTERALERLKNELASDQNLEIRVIESSSNPLADETLLFENLQKTLADVPPSRRAGVMIISDGQVHDVPKALDDFGPIHLLLSGKKDERDRRIVVENAPAYGIVGDEVEIRFRVEDTQSERSDVLVTLETFDEEPLREFVSVGEEFSFKMPIRHAGQNIFQLSVAGADEEITLANNKAAILVNGVRDRLRVLLVSGKPHAGGRMWRDLLTSDPGVDLIHFTILREPDKLDATPRDELSLIAFPFRELFEVKLYDFDLIIFDRYKLNRILPDFYFSNIARFVREGGALLEASGPAFAGPDSIYLTPLMEILPAIPNGEVMKTSFTPSLTKNGNLHPVTRNLNIGRENWGPWLRQVGLQKQNGDTLLAGLNDNPLLILDRVDEGRVAQIASDHMWLWARGYQGGGPHQELLRRIVHWLMKEPELDEKALDVQVDDSTIKVLSRDLSQNEMRVSVTRPDETTEEITLKKDSDGFLSHSFQAEQIGVYQFEDEKGQIRYAAVGALNPKELSDVLTSPEPLSYIIEESDGGVFWLSDTSPDIRSASTKGPFSGQSWLRLRQNNAYNVAGLKSTPLLPAWAMMVALFSLLTLMWWREGKN